MEFNQTFAPATRDYLLGFAQRRLRDAEFAEEVVQETLLAAWRFNHSFAGKSSEKTWLVGMLKHKIADCLRRVSRERGLFESEYETDEFFDRVGRWQAAPSDWNDPWQALTQKEFQIIMQQALQALPLRQAQVFWLREVEEFSTEEICKTLELSATNTLVLLHRARLRLRAYLEIHWFSVRPS